MAQSVLEPAHVSVQIKTLFSHCPIKKATLGKWTEHFNSVLNRPPSINEDAIDRLPQIECNVLLDEFPTVMETTAVIWQKKLQVQTDVLEELFYADE